MDTLSELAGVEYRISGEVLLQVFGVFALSATLTSVVYRLSIKYEVDWSTDLTTILRDIADTIDGGNSRR